MILRTSKTATRNTPMNFDSIRADILNAYPFADGLPEHGRTALFAAVDYIEEECAEACFQGAAIELSDCSRQVANLRGDISTAAHSCRSSRISRRRSPLSIFETND